MNETNYPNQTNSQQWPPIRPGELRQRRDALGWTQKRMAAAIAKRLPPDSDTFDLQTYQLWERGKALPSDQEYQAVRQVLQKHTSPLNS